jgi:hypothetical protein
MRETSTLASYKQGSVYALGLSNYIYAAVIENRLVEKNVTITSIGTVCCVHARRTQLLRAARPRAYSILQQRRREERTYVNGSCRWTRASPWPGLRCRNSSETGWWFVRGLKAVTSYIDSSKLIGSSPTACSKPRMKFCGLWERVPPTLKFNNKLFISVKWRIQCYYDM